MEFDDLKSDWQNTGSASIDEKHLRQMTRVSQHPTLKKLRLKMIIEVVLLSMLLFVYYDGFDGAKKPLYANVLLVFAIGCYIANNVIGYIFIKNPVKGNNILLSIQAQAKVLKRLSVLSMLFSFVYAAALLLFFSSSIEFTLKKYLLLATVCVVSVILFFFSFKNWKTKIIHFEKLHEELATQF